MPTITELFAFIAEDNGPDDEGVAAFLPVISQAWMPMIAADARRLDSLRPIARRVARESGKTLRLCRFSVREEIERIDP